MSSMAAPKRGHQRRVYTDEKSDDDRRGDDEWLREFREIEGGQWNFRALPPFQHYIAHVHPVEHRPVDEEACDGDGREMQEEVAVVDARERSDQHVLRVAG